jgi:uncharacterized phiE125 gp8 family phage protein
MILKRIVPPATAAMSLADMLSHLRIDSSDDNDVIAGQIAAAVEYLEGAMHRSFITQTWRLSLECWPARREIDLPLASPLQAVTSVTYLDTDGVTNTLAASAYVVDTDSEPGRVVLKRDETWPGDELEEGPSIQVTYVAGYGDDPTDVPWMIRQAIKLLAAHWYENRETSIVGAGVIASPVPFAVDSLIWLNRA